MVSPDTDYIASFPPLNNLPTQHYSPHSSRSNRTRRVSVLASASFDRQAPVLRPFAHGAVVQRQVVEAQLV